MTMYLPNLEGREGPKYRRIADAIGEDIRSGTLPAETKLPTHRDLAYRLGVTVGTVSRAYHELLRRGLTGGRVGSGTFVLGRAQQSQVFPIPPAPAADPDHPELVHAPPANGVIDLSMNRPVPGPEGQALAETLSALSSSPDLALLTQYNPAPGLPHHRAAMADMLADVGLACTGDDLILTSGAQHAMASAALGLLRTGDVILTEELTYPGMTSLAAHLGARVRGVAMDEFGMRPDALEAAVRDTGARVIYMMPVHQNPTTATMDAQRLADIARVVEAHDLMVIEDDVYGFQPALREPPLAALIPDNVLYISGFAKSIAPGLRVGCIKAPKAVFNAITQSVQITGWMIPPLMGEIAARWITSGVARELIAWHRDEMIARNAIAAEILHGLDMSAKPDSLHLWLRLPDDHQPDDVLRTLRAKGVVVAGPQSFTSSFGIVPRAIRLCLGSPPTRDGMTDGLRRVTDVLTRTPVSGLVHHDTMVM